MKILNKLELMSPSIKVGGSNGYSVELPENAGALLTEESTNSLISTAKTEAINESKNYTDQKVSSVYRVKGTVPSVEDLPEDAEIGDVYNISDDLGGHNYVKTESGWDKLGGTVDLSPYALKTDVSGCVADLESKITAAQNSAVSTSNAYTDACIVAANLSQYAKAEDVYTKGEVDDGFLKARTNDTVKIVDDHVHFTGSTYFHQTDGSRELVIGVPVTIDSSDGGSLTAYGHTQLQDETTINGNATLNGVTILNGETTVNAPIDFTETVSFSQTPTINSKNVATTDQIPDAYTKTEADSTFVKIGDATTGDVDADKVEAENLNVSGCATFCQVPTVNGEKLATVSYVSGCLDSLEYLSAHECADCVLIVSEKPITFRQNVLFEGDTSVCINDSPVATQKYVDDSRCSTEGYINERLCGLPCHYLPVTSFEEDGLVAYCVANNVDFLKGLTICSQYVATQNYVNDSIDNLKYLPATSSDSSSGCIEYNISDAVKFTKTLTYGESEVATVADIPTDYLPVTTRIEGESRYHFCIKVPENSESCVWVDGLHVSRGLYLESSTETCLSGLPEYDSNLTNKKYVDDTVKAVEDKLPGSGTILDIDSLSLCNNGRNGTFSVLKSGSSVFKINTEDNEVISCLPIKYTGEDVVINYCSTGSETPVFVTDKAVITYVGEKIEEVEDKISTDYLSKVNGQTTLCANNDGFSIQWKDATNDVSLASINCYGIEFFVLPRVDSTPLNNTDLTTKKYVDDNFLKVNKVQNGCLCCVPTYDFHINNELVFNCSVSFAYSVSPVSFYGICATRIYASCSISGADACFDSLRVNGSDVSTKSYVDSAKSSAISTSKSYTDEKISALGSVLEYKGNKTYEELPTEGNEVGDVYNITADYAEKGIKSGDNIVWNGSDWDVLSGPIDLSGYYDKGEVDDKLERYLPVDNSDGILKVNEDIVFTACGVRFSSDVYFDDHHVYLNVPEINALSPAATEYSVTKALEGYLPATATAEVDCTTKYTVDGRLFIGKEGESKVTSISYQHFCTYDIQACTVHLVSDPTDENHATPKSYVDARVKCVSDSVYTKTEVDKALEGYYEVVEGVQINSSNIVLYKNGSSFVSIGSDNNEFWLPISYKGNEISDDTHLTPKSYVDAQVKTTTDAITTLSGCVYTKSEVDKALEGYLPVDGTCGMLDEVGYMIHCAISFAGSIPVTYGDPLNKADLLTPTDDGHLTNKKYVDDLVSTSTSAANANIVYDEDFVLGDGTFDASTSQMKWTVSPEGATKILSVIALDGEGNLVHPSYKWANNTLTVSIFAEAEQDNPGYTVTVSYKK